MIKKLTCSILALLSFSITLQLSAASKTEIDATVQEALNNLYEESSASRELAQKAAGILVFPRVIKAGIGVGGEYGEGALLINGQPVEYYNSVSASIGFQLGAQIKSQVIMFMEQGALDSFRNSNGWEAGVDGSVALVELSAAGEVSSNSARQPIIGFIFSN